MTIYVPTDYVNNCNEVYSNFIRSYTSNDNTTFVDIYFKNDYILKEGSGSAIEVVCDNLNTYTDNVLYRQDFYKITIMVFVYSVLILGLAYKIFTKLFRRLGL